MRTITLLLLLGSCGTLAAAEDVQDDPVKQEQQERFDAFRALFDKSVMIGNFMVDGAKQADRHPELYEISKVTKLEKGDYWSFFARIQYGKHNVTVPVPVEVKWAGKTAVITVDNVTIPGLGTFDARVLISDNKYAGTWRHGKVGGLMFGHIKKQADKAKEDAAKQDEESQEDDSGSDDAE